MKDEPIIASLRDLLSLTLPVPSQIKLSFKFSRLSHPAKPKKQQKQQKKVDWIRNFTLK